MGPTYKLADFASRLQYEQIPGVIIRKMKTSLLDSIGCAIAGSSDQAVQYTYEGLKAYYPGTSGMIVGSGCQVSQPLAVLINSMMCHALEMDDLHKASKVHPGAVVAMGIGTMAASERCTGKQMLTAMTVGYETMIRLGQALGTVSHRKRGWHATATSGAVAMAAAAGNLLRCPQEVIANAIGIAGCQAAGSMAFLADGSMTKRFQVGKAAQNGWNAIRLAEVGLTGSTKVIEYEDGGLVHLMSDDPDLSRITDQLGQRFEASDIGWKMYACCGHTHQAIEAALTIKREHDVRPELIESVEIGTYEVSGLNWGTNGKPRNKVEGQFNFPYIIATALIDGEVFLEQFSPEHLDRDDVFDLAKRVTIHVDEQFTKWYPSVWSSEVRVKLRDGTVWTCQSVGAKGDKDHPLTMDEAQHKFDLLVGDRIRESQKEKICSCIAHLDQLSDYSELQKLLVVERRN